MHVQQRNQRGAWGILRLMKAATTFSRIANLKRTSQQLHGPFLDLRFVHFEAKRLMQKRHITLTALLCTSLLSGCASQRPPSPFAVNDRYPILLAHRGIAQTFPSEGVGRDTCTATRIHPPTHAFLENTIASMKAAISAGADVIEIDVHPTTDGEFAVFHDWTIDCRTEGLGRTRDQTMTYLRTLDAGYGYTADGGKTFPFRGKGVGVIPSLSDVLAALPSQRLLINVKSNDPKEGELLSKFLNTLPGAQQRTVAVYGAELPIAVVRASAPNIITMSRDSMKACLYRDMVVGWMGMTPSECENRLIVVPRNYAHWLWGWPDRFVDRMTRVGSAVYFVGDTNNRSANAINTVDDLARVPADFKGGIWTDEIQLIGNALKRSVPP
jgi:glycerophosphoryl diester phosphodiesterase